MPNLEQRHCEEKRKPPRRRQCKSARLFPCIRLGPHLNEYLNANHEIAGERDRPQKPCFREIPGKAVFMVALVGSVCAYLEERRALMEAWASYCLGADGGLVDRSFLATNRSRLDRTLEPR